MAAAPTLLIGGPLDGGQLSGARSRPNFLWITGSLKAFVAPGSRRHLYRFLGLRAGRDLYLYAGHTHRCCSACGGFTEIGEGERNPKCELCGTSLTP